MPAQELCSPGELLTGMAAMFDEVKGVYELFAQTWKTLIPRLESVQALAERATGLVEVSAGDERRRLEAPLAAVASFARAVARDPLSIRPEAITQLGDELESCEPSSNAPWSSEPRSRLRSRPPTRNWACLVKWTPRRGLPMRS